MQKISLTLDLSKINKENIIKRSYVNKDGATVEVREYKLDIVKLNEPKTIKTGTNPDGTEWAMIKTHFAAEPQTKEQRAKKEKSVILGDGIEFLTNKADGDIDF